MITLKSLIQLNEKVAIVTGGAAGIGQAIASRFAEAGALVIIADLNDTNGEKTTSDIIKSGYKAQYLHCDVSDESQIKNLLISVLEKNASIDILVNNAGIYPHKPLHEFSSEEFERVLSINLTGVFNFSREVSKVMIEKKTCGCIINLGSSDSVHPSSKGLSAYDASKGGVLMLTKSLALELGRYGIRVNAIAPGGILTRSVIDATHGTPTKEGLMQLKAFMSRTALGRMGEADEVARVALFLASELSSYMTGSLVAVDGGYLIS
ncbi:MAG: SDR family NAD(P)-dependent oxidoreductase [Chloroflexi bacterium]|nr:SDR family NAD(P)-dependent oxidoreductase [Chloroflexota bacterium]